ncbi:MAG: ribbon-helix-helix domain-containing protein [Methanomassiliicoccales archaeon]
MNDNEDILPDLEKVTIRLPLQYLQALDMLVRVNDFPSRSEAIRAAVRDLIYERIEKVTDKMKKMVDLQRSLQEMEELQKKFLK